MKPAAAGLLKRDGICDHGWQYILINHLQRLPGVPRRVVVSHISVGRGALYIDLLESIITTGFTVFLAQPETELSAPQSRI